MIEQLFGSKTRVKLLQLFYGNPNRSFYVREITRKIDEQLNSVRRELANLQSIGIISSENTNNKLYYEVNQAYPHYKALASIFGVTKITIEDKGEDDPLKAIGRVDLAILTGQFTRDDRSGVDFLVVGDINQTQLGKYVSELEKKEGKEIRYAMMPTREFLYRRGLNDRFLTNVMESKKQVLVDNTKALEPQEKSKKKETEE
ncbi:transcriptional regulator [Candidatus Saccharibacteria bacterium]|nr:transcriptional regulator [Candidatus Saccharibacteria bacterium]